eukprot:UN32288
MSQLKKATVDTAYYPKIIPGIVKKTRKINNKKPNNKNNNNTDKAQDIDFRCYNEFSKRCTKKQKEEGKREMITPVMREKLTKEGYKLLGSHSAVKLCRWTKAMLRGRGGCYKHTF